LPATRRCACSCALDHALLTELKLVPAATRAALAPIIGRFFPPA
jgi:hypothetical protein